MTNPTVEQLGAQVASLSATVTALEHRLRNVEDETAIRRLHHVYGYYMDYCLMEEAISLFARDGEAVFLSGVYRGHASLRRLYRDFLQGAYTARQPGPVYGFVVDHMQMQDVITVAPDGRTAQARFRAYLILGSHESRTDRSPQLPDQIYEAGLYENQYVREDGVWKIQRLEYALQWQADYARGWAHTRTSLPPALPCFPEHPLGPDYLLESTRAVWPERSPLDFHYVNPVTGRATRADALL
jgi:SnoaL-like domain